MARVSPPAKHLFILPPINITTQNFHSPPPFPPFPPPLPPVLDQNSIPLTTYQFSSYNLIKTFLAVVTQAKECGFKCGWCGFNPDYLHRNHIDKVGNVAYIWFMWIYSFLIVWLECGLCGLLNFNNILCGLFLAFVDLYKSLFLKSNWDMDLMWLYVDSVSIYTLKSQSSLSFKPNFRDGSKEWADSFPEGQLIGYQAWFCICSNKFFCFCSVSKVCVLLLYYFLLKNIFACLISVYNII